MNERGVIEIIYGSDILLTYSTGELIFMTCLIGISIGLIIFIILDLLNQKM